MLRFAMNLRKISQTARCTLLTVVSLSWSGYAQGADIERRTTMVCVVDQSKGFTALEGRSVGEAAQSATRSRFGQWLFSNNQDYGSDKIRFLWIPETSTGPSLKVHTSRTHHVLVEVRSQGRDSIVAVSSASDPLSVVGWLFSINFKLERITAAMVQSNAAGLQSQAVQLSCNFEDKTPQAIPPAMGNSIG